MHMNVIITPDFVNYLLTHEVSFQRCSEYRVHTERPIDRILATLMNPGAAQ